MTIGRHEELARNAASTRFGTRLPPPSSRARMDASRRVSYPEGSEIVGGTHEEYAWFFRDEYPKVVRTVFLVVRDRGRSEEITQEAFIQLLGHWKKVSGYDQPQAWGADAMINEPAELISWLNGTAS